MRFLAKYWKALLALVLAAAAIPVVMKTREAEEEHRARVQSMESSIALLQSAIDGNMPYAGVQERLEPELLALQESREALYSRFPSTLLEEDQIRYILYLEETFGTEIHFSFSSNMPMTQLNDGSILGGVTLAVNFETTYEGFKEMVNYIATDSKTASVRYATINYDAENDAATGTMVITVYTLSATEYTAPEPSEYETGKTTIFE